VKTRGKLSAENPHAGFDVAGAGNVLCLYRGAPDLDPTGGRGGKCLSYPLSELGYLIAGLIK